MEPDQRIFTVRPEGGGNKWLVSEAGDPAAQSFDSKDAALEAAKKLAQGFGPSQLRVEKSDGSVEFECGYEKDPLVTQLEKFGF